MRCWPAMVGLHMGLALPNHINNIICTLKLDFICKTFQIIGSLAERQVGRAVGRGWKAGLRAEGGKRMIALPTASSTWPPSCISFSGF